MVSQMFKMAFIITSELTAPCQFFDRRTLINVLHSIHPDYQPMVAQFIYILPLTFPLLQTTKPPSYLTQPSPVLVMQLLKINSARNTEKEWHNSWTVVCQLTTCGLPLAIH